MLYCRTCNSVTTANQVDADKNCPTCKVPMEEVPDRGALKPKQHKSKESVRKSWGRNVEQE